MSPEGPLFPSPEIGNDKKEDKKRKKSVRFGVPVAKVETEQSDKETAEKKPPKRVSEALADSLIAKEEKEAKEAPDEDKNEEPRILVPEAKEETPQDTSVAETETVEPEAVPEQDTEGYEEMLEQELQPNQLGTEFVVSLSGDGPITEHVIPLRGEAPVEELPAEMPEQPAAEPYPVFTRQPEQQHQAGAVEVPEPIPAASGGGEVPPVPPENTPRTSGSAEDPGRPEAMPIIAPVEELQPYQPAEEAGGSALPNVSQQKRSGEWPATKKDIDEALHRSAQIHEQRGLVSGLLVGTWFANRGLRRRQKQEGKELSRQGRELKQLREEIQATSLAQQSHETNSTARFSNVEKRLDNKSTPEKLSNQAEQKSGQRQVEADEQTLEQLNIPSDHRLETSAWHSIEVDNKTGKPVEQPTFNYGREYYRERAQEAKPHPDREAATGEAALLAAAQAQSGSNLPPALSSAQIPSASMQGSPSTSRTQTSGQSQNSSRSQAGPIWPWIVALVGVVIALIWALH